MSPRPLAEAEAEAGLYRKMREARDRLMGGTLTPAEARLEREILLALGGELAALEAKASPAPEPSLLRELGLDALTPQQAAAKAAAIRADPRFFDPSKADGVGRRYGREDHAMLVRLHAELLTRAEEGQQAIQGTNAAAPVVVAPTT